MQNEPSAAAIAWQLERMECASPTESDARAVLIAADESAAPYDRIAGAFATLLRGELTLDQWQEMRATNAECEPLVCASGDYCDSNVIMAEAFKLIMGRDILPDDQEHMTQADCDLWNVAWDAARRDYLTGEAPGEAPCPIHRQPIERCPDRCKRRK